MTYQLIDTRTNIRTDFETLVAAREATLELAEWELWHVNTYNEFTFVDDRSLVR
jgi:hypothetical protein